MPHTPMLEYAPPSPKWRKFRLGFLAGSGAAVLANIVPYVFSYHAYGGDGFEVVGFPLTFREQGGYVYRYTFSVRTLVLDAIFCLAIGLAAGVTAAIWKGRFPTKSR